MGLSIKNTNKAIEILEIIAGKSLSFMLTMKRQSLKPM